MPEKPFNSEELPPEIKPEPAEPIKGEQKINPSTSGKPEKKAMSAGVGEVLVSKSGTRRKITGFRLDKKSPGGGFLDVETTKVIDGKTEVFKEKVFFEKIKEAKDKGTIAVEPEDWADRKKAEIQANEARKQKMKEVPEPQKVEEKSVETKKESVAEKGEAPFKEGQVLVDKKTKVYRRKVLRIDNVSGIIQTEDMEHPGDPNFVEDINFQRVNDKYVVEGKKEPEAPKPKVIEKEELPAPKEIKPKKAKPAAKKPKALEKTKTEIPMAQLREEISPLDAPGLAEFLGGYDDAESVEVDSKSAGKIKERSKAFEEKNFTEQSLAELYKTEFEPVLGVEIGKEELAPLSDFLTEEARKNPERLRERVVEVKEYNDLKKEIVVLEEDVKKLGGVENYDAAMKKMTGDQEVAEKYRGVVKWSTGWRGFLNPKNSELLGGAFRMGESGDRSNLRKQMREKSGWVANIFFTSEESKKYFAKFNQQIEELAKKRDFLGGYPFRKDYLKAQFDEMKKNFFMNFEPAKAMMELARNKSIEQLGRLIDSSSTSLEGLEKAQENLETLKRAKEALDFEQLADLPIEQFQKDIDAAMEEVVSLDVIDKVRKFEIGNKAFSKLRAQLNDHLVREVLGSKGKKETRELINHILKNEMHRLIQEKKEGYKEKLVYLKVIAADLIGS